MYIPATMKNISRFPHFAMVAFALLLLTLKPNLGLAWATFPEFTEQAKSSFRMLIESSLKQCSDLNCKNSEVQAEKLSSEEISALGSAELKKLTGDCQKIAEMEWPDTILEGPYVASFHIRIRAIESLTYKDNLVGYRLNYSDSAWDTDTCDYNPEDKASLKKCKKGLLVESIFVSTKTGEAFRDPYGVVEFQPKN